MNVVAVYHDDADGVAFGEHCPERMHTVSCRCRTKMACHRVY